MHPSIGLFNHCRVVIGKFESTGVFPCFVLRACYQPGFNCNRIYGHCPQEGIDRSLSLSSSLATEGVSKEGERREGQGLETQPATEVALRAPNVNLHSFPGLGSCLLNLISLLKPKKTGKRGPKSPFYRKENSVNNGLWASQGRWGKVMNRIGVESGHRF